MQTFWLPLIRQQHAKQPVNIESYRFIEKKTLFISEEISFTEMPQYSLERKSPQKSEWNPF